MTNTTPKPGIPDDLWQYQILPYADLSSLKNYALTGKQGFKWAIKELNASKSKRNKINLIVAGRSNFIATDQGLFACGYNQFGQLGLGNNANTHTFTLVTQLPPGNILHISASDQHAIIQTDQGVFTCGRNDEGQLGLGNNISTPTFMPVTHLPPGNILHITTGDSHTIIHTDQGVFACGHNGFGQLGLGDDNNRNIFTLVTPLPAGQLLHISVGFDCTFIHTDQGVFACGHNEFGQLGLGDNVNKNTFTKIIHLPGNDILHIAIGFDYTVIQTNEGVFVCGDNDQGQLGLGNNISTHTFVPVTHLPPGNILHIATGNSHTAIHTDQGVFVCGNNHFGQLGLGDNENRNIFSKITYLPGNNVLFIATGFYYTFMYTDQGLFACGSNSFGQLALGNNTSTPTFTQVNLNAISNSEKLYSQLTQAQTFNNYLLKDEQQTQQYSEQISSLEQKLNELEAEMLDLQKNNSQLQEETTLLKDQVTELTMMMRELLDMQLQISQRQDNNQTPYRPNLFKK